MYVRTIKRVAALSVLEVRRHVGLSHECATATTPEPTHSNSPQYSFWYFFFYVERKSTLLALTREKTRCTERKSTSSPMRRKRRKKSTRWVLFIFLCTDTFFRQGRRRTFPLRRKARPPRFSPPARYRKARTRRSRSRSS